ncbi:hypothetical protein L2U69_12040 [Zavarzinia compransoris]|uniref:hypothetical protein n=1 Tax=Zavarzinia marina TaxID=2911065 RepID=UPI001F159009|nr:hypothetical protein [Zavarzinia marina]MCF4166377.1 hypothetical protein [Zavarzinia marina]
MKRVLLGIDGNCGFALLGANLQEGEVEFVEVPPADGSRSLAERQSWAATQAYRRLQKRLDEQFLYILDQSHPRSC